ncbi:hypothetical protein [Corynebacterium sp. NML130628]|uniref:hypothetical protein n=1 Tax=Corynebacterium sp. NML130628 TaxID=1906333 RepID=UPI0008FBBCD5|nr:hypothetical protein [Corynebacterium sp. NML130628]OIR44017.1 hypothetical protein BJP07_05960 [Corynebacterium sp. NML130628]
MKKQFGLMLVATCSAAMLVAPQVMAQDTAPEKDGLSTGGIIAGVVLGLLAIVGIVVAINPGILNMF